MNTTDQPKAIRIRFLEGDIGRDVLSFNVYLSPFDVWTGALGPTVSTLSGHVGESSVIHFTGDTSCAPYLIINGGQEFFPFAIDVDQPNNNLNRATEGHLEVIEMGVLTGNAAQAIDHGFVGVPADCDLLEQDWADNGEWDLDPLEEPSGGLIGSVSLVNVAEGMTFSYDAIALENFWGQTAMHTQPGSPLPDLSSAFPESRVFLSNGELAISEWSTGFEAVSAVLMQGEIYNEYAYDSITEGKSEWVVSFPTKIYHTDVVGSPIAPFTETWDGSKACDGFDMKILDREAQIDIDPGCAITCPPQPDTRPKLCYSSNVTEIVAPDIVQGETSGALGSDNFLSVPAPSVGTSQSGWALIEVYEGQFDQDKRMIPVTGIGYRGLPMAGFMVQQFTNPGAANGLLAHYAGLFTHKGLMVAGNLGEDLVFRHAFE